MTEDWHDQDHFYMAYVAMGLLQLVKKRRGVMVSFYDFCTSVY